MVPSGSIRSLTSVCSIIFTFFPLIVQEESVLISSLGVPGMRTENPLPGGENERQTDWVTATAGLDKIRFGATTPVRTSSRLAQLKLDLNFIVRFPKRRF